MKEYIKHQLDRLDLRKGSQKQVRASLKGIYAVLEEKGHNTHAIRKAIDDVIFENIKELIKKYREIL